MPSDLTHVGNSIRNRTHRHFAGRSRHRGSPCEPPRMAWLALPGREVIGATGFEPATSRTSWRPGRHPGDRHRLLPQPEMTCLRQFGVVACSRNRLHLVSRSRRCFVVVVRRTATESERMRHGPLPRTAIGEHRGRWAGRPTEGPSNGHKATRIRRSRAFLSQRLHASTLHVVFGNQRISDGLRHRRLAWLALPGEKNRSDRI